MQKRDNDSMSSKSLVSCGNCKASPRANASRFMSCGLCKQISYCCKECQTVDWPRHKSACKAERNKQTNQVTLSDATAFKDIENLISNGSDLNKRSGRDENTLLLITNTSGFVKCVNLLLQHRADPNIANKDNAIPLYVASQNGHDACVSALLRHGADPNIAIKYNITPLSVACCNDHVACVPALLQHGADHNIADSVNITPLYLACENGNDNCVSALLQFRADPNIATNDNLHLYILHVRMATMYVYQHYYSTEQILILLITVMLHLYPMHVYQYCYSMEQTQILLIKIILHHYP